MVFFIEKRRKEVCTNQNQIKKFSFLQETDMMVICQSQKLHLNVFKNAGTKMHKLVASKLEYIFMLQALSVWLQSQCQTYTLANHLSKLTSKIKITQSSTKAHLALSTYLNEIQVLGIVCCDEILLSYTPYTQCNFILILF